MSGDPEDEYRNGWAVGYDDGRQDAAKIIQAHADRVKANGTTEARRMARHLEVAARLAAKPITMAQLAVAVEEFIQAGAPEGGHIVLPDGTDA